jgi:GNAT superfamily N-acetyltransferase/N-acetylglutamate synthase-like GNAT family acetyltransferase
MVTMLNLEISPLTPENLDVIYDFVTANTKFFSLPKEYFIRGTLKDEGYDPDLALIISEKNATEPIGVLIAVIRKGMIFGKNCFVKVLVIANSLRRKGIASKLMDTLIQRVKPKLPWKSWIRFGDSIPRFWQPGVDVRYTDLRFFLKKCGFKKKSLRQNMTYNIDSNMPRPLAEKSGYHLERVQEKDYEALFKFVKKEFGMGVWPQETKMSFENNPPTSFVVKESSNGSIVGWATHSAHFPGSFGPTGVLSKLRGKGLGSELLKWCMWDIKENGLNASYILWVVRDTVKFYSKSIGAYISPVYFTMSRRI